MEVDLIEILMQSHLDYDLKERPYICYKKYVYTYGFQTHSDTVENNFK